MPPNNMASIFKFGGLCYDGLGLSRLNGTDKIINLVFQIHFPVLRDTPQDISYNIYATFDIATRSFASGSFNESYNVMILPIVMNSMVFHAGAYIPEWFA